MSPVTAYIALGSNLGDRAANIRAALAALESPPDLHVTAVSPLFKYPAVDSPEGSPPFLNGAAQLQTALSPSALLDRLLDVERHLGRQRSVRNAPRQIDLDLLLYGHETLHLPHLTIPHPRMPSRRFVLEPLARLAPDLLHPTLHRPIRDLLADLNTA